MSEKISLDSSVFPCVCLFEFRRYNLGYISPTSLATQRNITIFVVFRTECTV